MQLGVKDGFIFTFSYLADKARQHTYSLLKSRVRLQSKDGSLLTMNPNTNTTDTRTKSGQTSLRIGASRLACLDGLGTTLRGVYCTKLRLVTLKVT